MTETFKHFTDCGAAEGAGVDTTHRIEEIYNQLGVNSKIYPELNGPIDVAFAYATAEVEKKQLERINAVREICGIKTPPNTNPVALNSAPRNAPKAQENGVEDNIFWLKQKGESPDLLIYGPRVLEYTVLFFGDKVDKVLRVESIDGALIPDTSNGTQFRSKDYLPLAQVLAKHGELENNAQLSEVDLSSLQKQEEHILEVLPREEFHNGRLLVSKDVFDAIVRGGIISIPEFEHSIFKVTDSLTNVEPGELAIWPFSNQLPNKNLRILGYGSRWEEGKERQTNLNTLEVVDQSQHLVGEAVGFSRYDR